MAISASTKAGTVKLASCRIDANKEREGTWEDSILIPGARFKVRSLNYPPYVIARDHLFAKLRRQIGARATIPEEILKPGLGRLYAEHILLGWEGFDTEYSVEVARDTLADPEFREMVDAVGAAAAQVGTAEIAFVEEDAKNSGAPSAGS